MPYQVGLPLIANSVGLFGEIASTSWDYIEHIVLVHHNGRGLGRERNSYLFGRPITLSYVFAVVEPSKNLVDGSLLLLQLLHLQALATSSCLLGEILFCLFHKLDVFYPQLFGDDVQISSWVDIALDVGDLGVVETSYNLEDSIDCSNMREESISQACTC